MSNLNKNMKIMGRGLARAANQSSSSKVPQKYAGGGAVSVPNKPCPPGAGGPGKARGGKAQTKGKGFAGVW